MTYTEFIQNIIDTRGQWNIQVGEYFEMHHIKPHCLGGAGDLKNGRFTKNSHHINCIWLYAQEHYEAHRLLALENQNNLKLVYGYWAMCTIVNKDTQERYILTADEYAEAKKLFHSKCSGPNNVNYHKPMSAETRKRLSEAHIGQGLGNIYIYKPGVPAKSISPDLLEAYLAEGWLLGNGKSGTTLSEEQKHKISIATKQGMLEWRENNPEEYLIFCKNISEKNKGKIMSTEAKQKISQKNSGVNNGMHKHDLSIKEYKLLHGLPIQRVLCVELNIIYDSVKDASQATGIGTSHISRCCLHRYGFKTAGGYHWEFVD